MHLGGEVTAIDVTSDGGGPRRSGRFAVNWPAGSGIPTTYLAQGAEREPVATLSDSAWSQIDGSAPQDGRSVVHLDMPAVARALIELLDGSPGNMPPPTHLFLPEDESRGLHCTPFEVILDPAWRRALALVTTPQASAELASVFASWEPPVRTLRGTAPISHDPEASTQLVVLRSSSTDPEINNVWNEFEEHRRQAGPRSISEAVILPVNSPLSVFSSGGRFVTLLEQGPTVVVVLAHGAAGVGDGEILVGAHSRIHCREFTQLLELHRNVIGVVLLLCWAGGNPSDGGRGGQLGSIAAPLAATGRSAMGSLRALPTSHASHLLRAVDDEFAGAVVRVSEVPSLLTRARRKALRAIAAARGGEPRTVAEILNDALALPILYHPDPNTPRRAQPPVRGSVLENAGIYGARSGHPRDAAVAAERIHDELPEGSDGRQDRRDVAEIPRAGVAAD